MRALTAIVPAARRRVLATVLAVLFVASLVSPAVAGAETVAILEQRLVPNISTYGYYRFGYSLDIQGSTLVVGDSMGRTVSVVQETGDGWTETDRVGFSRIGESVALDSDRAAIGAHPAYESARVYPLNSGSFDQTAAALVDAWSVAMDGELLVGGKNDRIHVYRASGAGWTLIGMLPKIAGTGAVPPTVVLSGDTFAYSDVNAGTIRLYRVGADDSLTEEGQVPGSLISYEEPAVALSGDTLVVGSGGAVDVYERSGTVWAHDETLLPSAVSANARFGQGVDVEGSTIAVGAPRDVLPNGDWGSVFLYRKQGEAWTETLKILSEEGLQLDDALNQRAPDFGATLDIDGSHLVVGAYRETWVQLVTGAVYVYEISDTGYPANWMQAPSYLVCGWSEWGPRMYWRNPPESVGFVATRVLRRVGAPPTGPTDPNADVMYEGTEESCPGIEPPYGATIYYAAYSRNAAGVWSKAATDTEVTPPNWSSVWVPVGENVSVSTNGVTLTFPRVTQAGSVTVSRSQPLRTPPNGRRWVADGYLDIHPVAIFEGPVQVTIDFDEGDAQRPQTLRLDHWNGTAWETISSGGANGGSITGSVSSFSEFGVSEASGESSATPIVSSPASTEWSVGLALLGMLVAVGLSRQRSARN